jgi:ferredoxin
MKCAVVYFSQTGNTKKMALAIAQGLEAAGAKCDLLRLADADPTRMGEYDMVGIGSMVIGAEPPNVSAFIERLQGVEGKHNFVFYTHGAIPFFYLPSVWPKLAGRGLVVIGARGWYAGAYMSHCPKPYFTDGHPDATDIEEGVAFGRELVETSRALASGEDRKLPEPPPLKDIPFPPFTPPEFVGVFPEKVQYHQELCRYPKCKLCMDNCPVGGIDLKASPPVVAKPCLDCEFCTKVCPTGAIEAKDYFSWMTPIFYNHARLTFFRLMREAEEKGTFRRLVPEADVGFDTPVAKLLAEAGDKHPYWTKGKGFTVDVNGPTPTTKQGKES